MFLGILHMFQKPTTQGSEKTYFNFSLKRQYLQLQDKAANGQGM